MPEPPATAAWTPSPECLARVARGEPGALAEVFGAYSRDIHRIAYAVTLSADDADDVVQDVFIGLPEALRSYREQGRFGAWLRIVAARTALMRRRRARRNVELSTGARDDRDRSDAVVERLTLERALGALPDEMRAVFVLKVIEGYSHDEIAQQLGIRRGTAEVRLFRAIRRLRALLATD